MAFELTNAFDSLIYYYTRKCPELRMSPIDQEKQDYDQWIKDDAKAASLIACALSKNIAGLVLTCRHANEIWKKLLARFEWSNAQRLNMLIEQFYKIERDQIHDIHIKVEKLQ